MAEELPKLDYDTDAQTDFANKLVGLANSLPQLDHKEDYKWAFELASKAAEKNNPDAIWNLALCYQNGRGVRKNIKRAIKAYVDILGDFERGSALDLIFESIDNMMKYNMGGGLPIRGFYEMKQEVYETAAKDAKIRKW